MMWAQLVLTAAVVVVAAAVELTFELSDNAKECFHEDIPHGTDITLEFQVVTGGQYDVDVMVEGPGRQILYREVKQQFGRFQFKTTVSGTYQICFSNEFSTFSHKLVYMDLQVGEEPQLPGVSDHYTALTQMESSSLKVHNDLKSVVDFQTHHRLKEAQGRKRQEEINVSVMYWAAGESFAVLAIACVQVAVLKNFFAGVPEKT